jgi:hypothetical protein
MAPHALELTPDAAKNFVVVFDTPDADAFALAAVPGVALSRFFVERVGHDADLMP